MRRTGSLIAAIDREPDRFDRRNSNRKYRGKERRSRGSSSIGIDISPSGVSLAIVQEVAGDQRYSLTTNHIAFDPTSGPFRGDWSTDELCAALTVLSEKHKLSGQAVSVGLGGEPCVTRAWKGDNEEVDASIRELTERAHRYLSLGHGEKVCCYAEKPIDAKRKRAWVTVARRGVIDAVASAVSGAGMRLTRLEHSLSALCQAIGNTGHDSQQPVLVVTTGFGRTDLGISYRGQLILDYRPARLESNLDSDQQDWPQAVSRHIKCLRRFLQKQLPRGENHLEKICLPGREAVPIGVSGELRRDHELDCFALSIREFTRDMDLKNQPGETADTLTAIWLAIRALQQRPKVAADLMESLRTEKEFSWSKVAKLTWPLAASLMLTLVLQFAASWEEVRRNMAGDHLEELHPSRRDYEHLKWKIEKHQKKSETVTALVADVPTADWNSIIKFSGRALPQGTWLKSLSIEQNSQVVITGASFTNDAIYEYLNRLRDSQSFARVTLLSTRNVRLQSGPAIEFEISATENKAPIQSRSNDVAIRDDARLDDFDGNSDYSVIDNQPGGRESNG